MESKLIIKSIDLGEANICSTTLISTITKNINKIATTAERDVAKTRWKWIELYGLFCFGFIIVIPFSIVYDSFYTQKYKIEKHKIGDKNGKLELKLTIKYCTQ